MNELEPDYEELSPETPLLGPGDGKLPDMTGGASLFTEEERARMNARAALIAAGDMAAPDLAWTRETAKTLGIPERVAMLLPEDTAREALARVVTSMPALAAFGAESPQNGALVRDNALWAGKFREGFSLAPAEAERLGELADRNRDIFSADYWKEWAENAGAFGYGIIRSLNAGGWDLGVNIAATLRSGAELLADMLEGEQPPQKPLAEDVPSGGGDRRDGIFSQASFAASFRKAAKGLIAAENWMEKTGGGHVRGDNVISQFMFDLANQAPQVGVTLLLGLPGLFARAGAAALAANAGRVGLTQAVRQMGAGSVFMGSQIYGGSYRELRGEGVNAANAFYGALINSAGQMPMEMLGATALGTALAGAGQRSFFSFYRRVGSAAAIEGMTEFLQQWPEYVGHLWAKSSLQHSDFLDRFQWFAREATDATNLMNALKQGIYEGMLGAAMGGGIGAIGYVKNRKAIGEARDEFDRLTSLAGEVAERLADARRLDRAFQEADRLGTDRDMATRYEIISRVLPENNRLMWLSAPDLAALLQEEEIVETLGVSREEITASINEGRPLQVDAARVLASQSGTAKKARRKLRPEATGISLEEAGGWDQERLFSVMARSLLQEESEEIPQEGAQFEELRGWRIVYRAARKEMDRVRAELLAGMTTGEADAHCEHLLAHALAFYRTYGVSPAQLIRDRYNVEYAAQYSPETAAPETVVDSLMQEEERELAQYREAALFSEENAGENGGGNAPRDMGDTDFQAEWAAYLAEHPEEKGSLEADGTPETPGFPDNADGGLDAGFEGGFEDGQADMGNQEAEWEAYIAAHPEEFYGADDNTLNPEAASPDAGNGAPGNTSGNTSSNPSGNPSSNPSSNPSANAGGETGANPDGAANGAENPGVEGSGDASANGGHNPGPDGSGNSDPAASPGNPQTDSPRENGGNPANGPSNDAGDGAGGGDGRRVVRGQTLIRGAKALVRLFSCRNLSTFLHEAGHIYIDDLLRVARDTGNVAKNNLFRNLVAAIRKDGRADRDTLIRLATLYRGHATAANGDIYKGLSLFREDLLRRHGEAKAALAKNQARQKALGKADPATVSPDEKVALINDEATLMTEAKTLATAIRYTALAQKQIRNLGRARQDVLLLARYAGLSEEAANALLMDPGNERPEYVEFQEKSVNAFLGYFMAGYAPTKKLEAPMRRFTFWLKSIYANARKLVARNLNPEISGVFDRLLAGEDELARRSAFTRARLYEEEFLNADFFTPEQRAMLADMLDKAKRLACEEARKTSVRNQEEFRRGKKREFLAALRKDPFWQVAEEGGLAFSEAEAVLGTDAARALRKKRPGLLLRDGKAANLLLSEKKLPWNSGQELYTELYERLVKKGESRLSVATAMAEAETRAMLEATFADIMAAKGGAYENYLKRVDEILWQALFERSGGKAGDVARALNVPNSEIRREAANAINQMTLPKIRVAAFQAMLEQALRERANAIAVANLPAAISAMRKARLASAMISEARKVTALADTLRNMAKNMKAINPQAMPVRFREAIRNVLGATGLGGLNIAADPDYSHKRLAEILNEIFPTDEENSAHPMRPAYGPWLYNLGWTNDSGMSPEITLNQMTPPMLQDLMDILGSLRKLGYDTGRQNRDSQAAYEAEIARQCAERMQALPEDKRPAPNTLAGRVRRLIGKAWNNVDALRWEFDRADGLTSLPIPGRDQNTGPMGRYMEEIYQAETREKVRSEKIYALMAPHITTLANSLKALKKKHGRYLRGTNGDVIPLPAAMARVYNEEGFTVDRLIALALNCGNPSNRDRIIPGYPDLDYNSLAELLGDDMAYEIASPEMRENAVNMNRGGLLSAADWQACQGIWDALATQWDDTVKAHERIFGFRPQAVATLPFTINTASGPVRLDGGYYPVRYDPNISDQVGRFMDEDDLLARNDAIVQTPVARSGFTRARADGAPHLPLLLNSGVLMEHIRDVVIFIEKGALVREIDRVTRHEDFKNAYIATYGQEDYDGIRPNLRGLVRNETITRNSAALVDYAMKLRPYLVAWGLSWNLNVAAIQATAIFPGMGDLGFGPMFEALRYMTCHGFSALREIHAVSPYMKCRLVNLDMDMQRNIRKLSFNREATITVGGKEIGTEDFVQLGMAPIIIVDAMATGAVWMATYNSKMREIHANPRHDIYKNKKGSLFNPEDAAHEQAVIYADKLVKQSNPDYDASSRSRFLRDVGVYRLFNGFSSAITLFAQRAHHMNIARKKGLVSFSEQARFHFYEYVAGGVAFGLIMGLLQGMGDEPEELTKKSLASVLDMYAMRVPLFGPALEYGLLNLMDVPSQASRFSALRTTVDVPMQIIAKATSNTANLFKGKEDAARKVALSVLDVVSFITRVPLSRKIEGAVKGHEQFMEEGGTPVNYLIPRPGKPARSEGKIMYGAFE